MLEVNELWFRGSIAKEFLEQRGSSVSISGTVAPAGRRVNRGREGFQHPRSRRGVRILVEGRRRAGWRCGVTFQQWGRQPFAIAVGIFT